MAQGCGNLQKKATFSTLLAVLRNCCILCDSIKPPHANPFLAGDPAEYESVRRALAGSARSQPIIIGSVKGHIGHTEGASGVISLIKIISMMQGGFIPPQASHTKMSHHIEVTSADNIEVATSLRPWDAERKAALINNYGASGSNASMVVTQSPYSTKGSTQAAIRRHAPSLPFCIAGYDGRSIAAYATKLGTYLQSRPDLELADIAHSVNRQSNHNLGQVLVFTCTSRQELQVNLAEIAASAETPRSKAIELPSERPVILCFGGQVSTFVGLDRKLYESVSILRHHLDKCCAVMTSLGLGSIYPEIFARTPVQDQVRLQTMLFAMQYACARAWLDCGIASQVSGVVGHSFGEITALCVAGVLSLTDTIKLVAGRAKLVRDAWGSDPGSMLAIEADEDTVEKLLKQSNASYTGDKPASIACYNGPRSFTLAGSTEAISTVAQNISSSHAFTGLRSKKLNVTNAFHSCLVDSLKDELTKIGEALAFSEPRIPVERATQYACPDLSPTFVADHMRNPVYFDHAVQRLAKRHPSAIFLEAGSSSTITIMASRALAGSRAVESSHFQAMNLTNDKGLTGLVDATTSLWKEGVAALFWASHPLQAYEYQTLLLPPYQFEKSRHWLEQKSPSVAVEAAAAALLPSILRAQSSPDKVGETTDLWTFLGNKNETSNCQPRFRINTRSEKYMSYVSGHLIAQTAPICPATLEVDMAIESLFSLHPDWPEQKMQPTLVGMINHSPICIDDARDVFIEFEAMNDAQDLWSWKIVSLDRLSQGSSQLHVEAKLAVRSVDDPVYQNEFARYERLVSNRRCTAMLALDLSDPTIDVLQGRSIYRAFSGVVDYGELYRGVKLVIGQGDECTGRVVQQHRGETWLDVVLSDCCSQVAGLWVNCMADQNPNDMFIATGCELLMRSPRAAQAGNADSKPSTWHVYARHSRQSDKLYITDVFTFDASTGQLAEVMLGIQYGKVAKASMGKMLTRLTTDKSVLVNKSTHMQTKRSDDQPISVAEDAAGTWNADAAITTPEKTNQNSAPEPKVVPKKAKAPGRPDITDEVRNLVASIAGIEAEEIKPDSELADFGIDSLMGMELAHEIEGHFKCKLDQAELMEATSLRRFVICISSALFGFDDGNSDRRLEDSSSDDETPTPQSGTPDDRHSSSDTSLSSDDEDRATKPKNMPSTEMAGGPVTPVNSRLSLSKSDVLDSFGEVKLLADKSVRDFRIDDFDRVISAGSNRLCTALIVEAFGELGSPMKDAVAGDILDTVPHVAQHAKLVDFLYDFLENTARLVNIDVFSGEVTRTHNTVPRKSSDAILQELLQAHPEWVYAHKLAHYAGKHLAAVLSGKTDGIRVIFGSFEGRDLVEKLYCSHTFNRMNYFQMQDVICRIVQRLDGLQAGEPLKILEMGAGTGGTTYVLAPFLATLERPIEYTFTDLSASMVANAKRKFGKIYPFMRFAVHDIENTPMGELTDQHIVLASNAVHATHNLVESCRNIRKALRPDGFLMMLEMTEIVPFVDIIFGLLEGWWLFDDGRKHAITPPEFWERDLHAAGFGHVDWTDGDLPENDIQKVIIAMASGTAQQRLPKASPEIGTMITSQQFGDVDKRRSEAESFVSRYSEGWEVPALTNDAELGRDRQTASRDAVVIITGATGSLGSCIAAQSAENPSVTTVVCINRRSSTPAETRQAEAFSSRGIALSNEASQKLKILETDTSKPMLGLSAVEWAFLKDNGTHIVHNAWPMSGTRPIRAFEAQFQTVRNLLDLARDIAIVRPSLRVGFQLVSSIGVVGHSSAEYVPEQRGPMSSVLSNGYSEAKWTCERLLDETLHKLPSHFRTMTVRPGQIAGSTASGYWNPVEHFAFLVKSAQAVRAWPDFHGTLHWVPVDTVAQSMLELLAIGQRDPPAAHPVYHIDNSVGQPWKATSRVLADAMAIPPERIVPFKAWAKLVRRSPLQPETENPAARLVDWLERNFERMSCGGLILDTGLARDHSESLAKLQPVSEEIVRMYVREWQRIGFLL